MTRTEREHDESMTRTRREQDESECQRDLADRRASKLSRVWQNSFAGPVNLPESNGGVCKF